MANSKFDPQKHHRHSIRLPKYDYAQPGAYFVTIVAWHRQSLFGEMVGGEVILNKVGQIVEWEWQGSSKRFQYIELGAYVVMPKHFHGILIFREHAGAIRHDSNQRREYTEHVNSPGGNPKNPQGSPRPQGPRPASLGAIIGQFKSRVTKRVWKIPSWKGTPIWQGNYYEHIIRNEKDLQNKTDYVNANPLLWSQDAENLLNIPS